MFSAAYTDEFYRSLRNALHYEVKQYWLSTSLEEHHKLIDLWNEVYRLEKRCKVAQPTQLPVLQPSTNHALAMCGAEVCG